MTLFRPAEERAVRELLARLERPVWLELVLGPEPQPLGGGRSIDFSGEARRVCEGVAALSELVSLTVRETSEAGLYPEIRIAERAGYHGLPWGYELSSLVGGILEAGRNVSSLNDASLQALATLDRDVSLDVFVTPT